jgi:hypothetical protein
MARISTRRMAEKYIKMLERSTIRLVVFWYFCICRMFVLMPLYFNMLPLFLLLVQENQITSMVHWCISFHKLVYLNISWVGQNPQYLECPIPTLHNYLSLCLKRAVFSLLFCADSARALHFLFPCHSVGKYKSNITAVHISFSKFTTRQGE